MLDPIDLANRADCRPMYDQGRAASSLRPLPTDAVRNCIDHWAERGEGGQAAFWLGLLHGQLRDDEGGER